MSERYLQLPGTAGLLERSSNTNVCVTIRMFMTPPAGLPVTFFAHPKKVTADSNSKCNDRVKGNSL